MLTQLILSFLVSLLACGWLVREGRRFAHRYPADAPQRFHAGDVPRLGGVAMLAAFVLVSARQVHPIMGDLRLSVVPWQVWVAVVLTVLPAVLGGIFEDLTHRLRPFLRFALTGVSATLAVAVLGLNIDRSGLAWFDEWWRWTPWFGITLAWLAVAGLPHSFNLIDGYNGLAGAVALAITAALTYVALKVGDWPLAALLSSLAGATAGFLVWNYPRGLLFAGDGGAYLWGSVLAIAAIALVQRNPPVSPWFPMLLLSYPVVETLFSVYRKVVRGDSPGVADALHFHQLIYRRIVRGVFHDDAARQLLMRNNRTSPYLWGFAMTTVVPAVLFWDMTPVLMLGCGLFVVGYVAAYLTIVRFKVPRWLRR
jgi:UDP-N-acetylmuramyl pentapeptide phosphotransferase/UDP-N-acetylglucosamine-1-phosphate transferase